MLNNILNLEGVTILNKKEQKNFKGGVTRAEYCGTLGGMIANAIEGNGGTNNLSLSSHFFVQNSGNYGYTIY